MRDASAIATTLRWEWFRLSRRPGAWVILGLSSAAVIGALAVATALLHLTPIDLSIAPHGFPLLAFEVLSRLGPFLGIILAAMIFGGDHGWGTLRPLLARGQPRWQLTIAKLSLVAIILAALWIAAWILAAVVGLVAGESDTVPGGLFPDTPDGWLATVGSFASAWLVSIAYAGLAALLCTLGRSTAFGMGAAVAILIIEFTVYPVAGLISDLFLDISLSEYIRWTLHGTSVGVMGRDDDLSAWLFLPATLAYITVFCALTLLVTGRRDVGSGNG